MISMRINTGALKIWVRLSIKAGFLSLSRWSYFRRRRVRWTAWPSRLCAKPRPNRTSFTRPCLQKQPSMRGEAVAPQRPCRSWSRCFYREVDLDGGEVDKRDDRKQLGSSKVVVSHWHRVGDVAEPGKEGAADDGDEDHVDILVSD